MERAQWLQDQSASSEGRGLSIAALVANGTMNAEIAAVLWAAVDAQLSFLTVAVPRNAGKSTTSNAVLALRPPEVRLHQITGDPTQIDLLKRERLGGYLVCAEFSRGPMPGYIWGEPVRRVFDALDAGYSLHSCLHAPSVADAFDQVTHGNGVADEQAAAIKLVIYIEMFGRSYADIKRRVAEVYEVHGIEGGRPIGHPLFRWQPEADTFEKTSEPHQFGKDRPDLERRAALIAELAASGRTSPVDVASAVADFRAKT
jgi:hypothetical protein